MNKIPPALFLLALLAGCAGPETPAPFAEVQYQTIAVQTPGVENASCVVQNGSRTASMMAPGRISLPRSTTPVFISCFKGEHLRGAARAAASYAPREAGMGEACISCAYPSTITVAMRLNGNSMAIPTITMIP
jgi:hypothetical protein